MSLVLALAACGPTPAQPSAGAVSSGTATGGGSATDVAAAGQTTASPQKEWTLPLQGQTAGSGDIGASCAGSVTLTAPGGWASVGQELVSSQVGTIDAYCSPSERYRVYHPDLEWTLPAVVALVWSNGLCQGEKPATVSGQEGAICSYTYDGSAFVSVNLLVGDYFVQISGQAASTTPAASAAMADILKTAVLTIS